MAAQFLGSYAEIVQIGAAETPSSLLFGAECVRRTPGISKGDHDAPRVGSSSIRSAIRQAPLQRGQHDYRAMLDVSRATSQVWVMGDDGYYENIT